MIVGFNIDSLEASRSEGAQGNLQIKYNPQIESVEEAQVSAFEDGEVARINFTFGVDYEAGGDVGASIELSGNVLWKGNVDEIVEEWEENEALPESIEAPFMNDLYRKCLSQAVGIADTLNLLPPIPTPRIDE
ncbi:MAG: hypothetical protein ABEI58_00310 [Candidatus Nanohaloarchaea archaeon]